MDKKKDKLKELETVASEGDFWQDAQNAGKVMKQIEKFKKDIQAWESIKQQAQTLSLLMQESDGENGDVGLLEDAFLDLEKEYLRYENIKLYSGKYDKRGAILSIHAGAGGVDAQDWAEMLFRMYLRYAERKTYEAGIIEEARGAEAGIKSVTVEIEGEYAYGNLKAEAGVHRLVRLSPFNADNLRQTSFAQVEVIPMLEDEKELVLNPTDLRIDTYRASGAGGQHVNKTDSAVRITHLPTNIVASCQSERSQLQNKQRAMAILKARVLQKIEQEKEAKERKLKGIYKSAEWGNQIRSYVLHPYKLVKDHRTAVESSDPQSVLDGNIDNFIEEYLRTNQVEAAE